MFQNLNSHRLGVLRCFISLHAFPFVDNHTPTHSELKNPENPLSSASAVTPEFTRKIFFIPIINKVNKETFQFFSDFPDSSFAVVWFWYSAWYRFTCSITQVLVAWSTFTSFPNPPQVKTRKNGKVFWNPPNFRASYVPYLLCNSGWLVFEIIKFEIYPSVPKSSETCSLWGITFFLLDSVTNLS